jgi:hypothetical protein
LDWPPRFVMGLRLEAGSKRSQKSNVEEAKSQI